MAAIQWFPGHMAKAQREIEEKLKLVDVVLELIDARIPFSSINPNFENLLKNKAKLIVMTKVKMADPIYNNKWKEYYEKNNCKIILVDSISGLNINKITGLLKEILKDKIEKDLKRGIKARAIKTMVIGIPNVGKSTLINTLVGKKMAQTANKPGVTKAQQWIRINKDLDLLDTPGVLWPKFDDVIIGYNLALTGAIRDDIVHKDDMTLYFIDFLKKEYKENFVKRYDLNDEVLEDNIEVLNYIARKSGFVHNGRIDYERVYELIINDFRSLKLGCITIERPISEKNE